jgi:uncharacterized membrane protein
LEEDYEKSSERTIIQVICNGLVAGVVVTLYQMAYESQYPLSCFDQDKWSIIMIWMYIGHYACCAGDTVSVCFHAVPHKKRAVDQVTLNI